MDVELHAGEAVAAEVRRAAREHALAIGLQVQPRRHPRHGVDHAAHLRHEEGVPHRRGGQAEVDRRARRNDQLVDGGDALVGVDEQPFPIHRDHLDVERRNLGCKRLARLKVMAADPGDSAEQHDGQHRDCPDDQLDRARIFPVRPVGRLGVAAPEPEGDRDRRDHRRDDDREHDRGRIDQDLLLGGADRADRIEDAAIAGGERQAQRDGGPAAPLACQIVQPGRVHEPPVTCAPRPRRKRTVAGSVNLPMFVPEAPERNW